MKKIKKGLKIFGFVILGLFLFLNLLIVISGKFYLYNGIAKTYLRGKSGPTIYDLELFEYNTVKKSTKPYVWKNHQKKNKFSLTNKDLAYNEKIKTRAFLVFRSDTMLYEKYWTSHSINTVSNSFSVAKSVISMLIGIAIEEGKIKSIEEPASNYLPEYKKRGREKITIKDLLLMASGLDWNESGKNPLSHNAEGYYGYDLKGLISRLNLVEKPGQKFDYQSGNTQILGFILEKATGKTVTSYMKEKIWNPLGAGSDAFWSLDKEDGDEKAFCCLYATARDFALLGRILINKGNVDGRQIVPKWYMEELIKTPSIQTSEGIPNRRYGLHTWVYYNNGNPVYYCRGLLGQYVMAIPSKDLIIVRLGEKRDKKVKKIIDKDKVGHTEDLFYFINLASKIASKIK